MGCEILCCVVPSSKGGQRNVEGILVGLSRFGKGAAVRARATDLIDYAYFKKDNNTTLGFYPS